jgi:colicin import membrane protein
MSILDGTGLTPQPAGISVDNQERGSLTDKSMWKELRKNPRALFYAVLMHLLLFLALILNLDWKTSHTGGEQGSVIKAQVVDSTKVQAEVNKLKQAQENKTHQEEVRKNELEHAAQQAEQRRVQEEQRLAEVKQQRIEEQQNQQKMEQQRIAQQKLEVERQSKLKIQQAEAAKQAKQKQAQEAKATQQRTAAEAKRKQEEAKQKAAEDKKRQAATAAKQQQADERALQQQIAAEEHASQVSGQNSELLDQYGAAIRQAIERNWRQPPDWPVGKKCEIHVNLMPGGDVVAVRADCGNPEFNTSVENAVRKAEPLPLPHDHPELFNDNFREMNIIFNPRN